MRLAGGALTEIARDRALNPWFVAVDELRRTLEERHTPFVSFANYDYLGLSADERIRSAAADAVHTHGIGALGSRLVGGERLCHQDLERELAAFLGTEATLGLVSGYLTNASMVTHLLSASDLIVYDELCHNSLIAGIAGSRATALVFRHNDLDHLDHVLTEHRSRYKRCLVLAEGLYSMDGDHPDLARLVEIKDRHGAWLLLDEAHSIGVLGERGRGLTERCGVDPRRVDLITGTLSKTFASCGGFVAAAEETVQWLRFTLPGFVYSVGMSPPIAAAARRALSILVAEPWRVRRLRENAELFVATARALGLETGSAVGRGIVPVFFGSNEATLLASQALLRQGFYCPPVVQVGVPKNQPRLRFFLSAAHEPQAIRQALAILAERATPAATQAAAE
jgi:8-amino-7-oxononanoate synthase